MDTGSTVGRPRLASSPPAIDVQGDVTLNFVNADIRELARAVLGDILKLPFSVDPRIQGTATLQTSRPVSKDAVLSVLETVLRMNGIAMVQASGIYNIIPLADVERYAPPVRRGDVADGPGFSTQIIPLRFGSADEVLNVLKSVIAPDSIIKSIPSRNILIASGSHKEIQGIVDLIALFDVDYLSGMSFALFYPKNVDAKTLIKEIEAVFAADKGGLSSMVRFTPIERLNAVLAVSRTSAYLMQAGTWVERLDQKADSVDERIFVYYVQNGRASDLATTLTSIFSRKPGDRTTGPAAGLRLGEAVEPGILGSAASPLPPGSAPNPPERTPSPAVSPTPAADQGIRLAGSSPPQITADETRNALIIMTTPRNYQVIQQAIARLDLPALQVMIEAIVAEVSLTSELEYGVQWFLRGGNSANFTLSKSATGSVTPTFPGFAAVLTKGANIRAVLSALESITTVHVLSSPQMMVMNNQSATLQVGDQVPIATQSATSVLTTGAPIVNTIQYRDTGVILKVTPRVNESGHVQMEISQEVSDVTTTTTSGLNSPTIQQRKFNSTVSVEDGDTVALGGLIKDRRTIGNTGIPIFRDVPVLGNLFKSASDADNRTELVVLITPRVVRSELELSRITDEFRTRLRVLTEPQMH